MFLTKYSKKQWPFPCEENVKEKVILNEEEEVCGCANLFDD